jgi:hypothetical protein
MTGFDTTPKPAFLRAMQNQRWKVAGALAELVDNSFGPGRGNAKRVTITHDTTNRTFTVLDDGQGMETVGRLFQLGNTIGRTPGDIGLYGSGGTMALLWLARRVSIWTLRDGKVNFDTVEWAKYYDAPHFPVVSNQWHPATSRNTPEQLLNNKHGTLIILHLMNERSFVASNVQRDLAQIYAPGLRMGKELTWITKSKGKILDERGLADPLDLPNDQARNIAFDLTLEIGEHHLGVHGHIGLIEGLAHTASVVSVGFGPRVIIRTRDCYESPDGNEKFLGTGVAGWLQLGEGWQPYLTTTKDEMNDKPAWDKLMGFVFDQIKPLLLQVEHDEFNIELEGIALQLQTAFNSNMQIDVKVGGERIPRPDANENIGERQGTDTEDAEKEPNQSAELEPTSNIGDDVEDSKPAITQITIFRSTDKEMAGTLCRADIWDGNQVVVEVNKDHHFIQEALKSKPVNRVALNFAVTREIAAELSYHQEILQKMFQPRVFKEIDKFDEQERERFVTRLLIDRVRSHRSAA